MDSSPTDRTEAHPRGEDSRAAILRAAIAEFSEQGEAGARTHAIATAAGVNKALLHYYFGTKEALYGAVLDEVFTGLADRFLAVIHGPGTPGERLLRYFLAHFDHLAAAGGYARLMGHEMMQVRRGEPTRISRVVRVCFGPLHAALSETVAEGIRTGELRPQDPGPAVLALTGVNVFYFISTPFFREISGKDPRDPAMLARQRPALLDFAATTLFQDPERGRALARRIHSEAPEPLPQAVSKGGMS
jgi:TetR/AcrR family transcriptional regulator